MPAINLKGKGELMQINSFRIKVKDFWDIKSFYGDLRFWLNEHGWKDLEDGDEHYETLFYVKQDQTGSKEHWIYWRLVKDIGSAFYKYYLDITWHNLGVKEQERMVNGKKLKLLAGEAELNISTYVHYDYTGFFSRNKILKSFYSFFYNWLFKKEAEMIENNLIRETLELSGFIKKWLKLKNIELRETFYPSKAFYG